MAKKKKWDQNPKPFFGPNDMKCCSSCGSERSFADWDLFGGCPVCIVSVDLATSLMQFGGSDPAIRNDIQFHGGMFGSAEW